MGGGPVGVALAVELGQRGVQCVLVERHQQPQRIPKGQNLTNRTLEHFYFWKCVAELRAARVLPPGYPTGGVTVYGDLMSPYYHAQQWGGRGASVEDFFYERDERLPQYCTEEVLRARLQQLPSVTTLFGWLAEQITQDDDGVRVAIAPAGQDTAFYSWSADSSPRASQEAPTAAAQVLEADYLVGCDGGRSLVRESMGIDRGGRNFDERMLLAVLRSRELHAGLARFPECATYRVLKPELRGYWQFFGRIDAEEGFFFHAPVPRATRPDADAVLGLLHEAAGFEFRAELDHVGFWDLRIMVASQYRGGRVFIAGDACHQHPPYGGFGLNTGLEDAVNLGWKLAARLRGWGGETLLDSYGEERRPIFLETGDELIAGGIEHDRAFLERYNPATDRAEFERAWAEMPLRGGFGVQGYDPHYAGSSVVIGPPGATCSIHGQPSFRAVAGHHLAPRRLSSGRNVFEELGDGFTLLAFDAAADAVSALEAAASAARVPLTLIRDSFADERRAYEARLVLVRPDQHVAWAGDQVPADPAGVFERIAGQT